MTHHVHNVEIEVFQPMWLNKISAGIFFKHRQYQIGDTFSFFEFKDPKSITASMTGKKFQESFREFMTHLGCLRISCCYLGVMLRDLISMAC